MRKNFKIFVYGTLKKGFSNHHYLSDSKFLGDAETVEKYVMYIKDNIPFVSEREKVSRIQGEIYSVTKNTLKRIDLLEENTLWYNRKEVKVKFKKSCKIVEAWLYFNEYEKGYIEKSGFFNLK